jgi:hypothetical protein
MATKKKSNDRHKGKAFTIRLDQVLADDVIAWAQTEQRTYGNMLAVLVKESLNARRLEAENA